MLFFSFQKAPGPREVCSFAVLAKMAGRWAVDGEEKKGQKTRMFHLVGLAGQ